MWSGDERVDRHSKLLLELQIKSTKVKTKGVRGLPHTHTRSKDSLTWCDCVSISLSLSLSVHCPAAAAADGRQRAPPGVLLLN